LKKWVRVTFGRLFSQTHLVTLSGGKGRKKDRKRKKKKKRKKRKKEIEMTATNLTILFLLCFDRFPR
jgi:hypothetical protein